MIINEMIKFFKYRWKAKVGSLIVAIFFYFYVQYAKTITKTYYIKVEPPNIPQNLVLTKEIPSFVKVIFSGPGELLEIDPSNFRILLINPGPTTGLNKFKLELMPPPPSSIQYYFEKSELEILLDNKKRKLLPVRPIYELSKDKQVFYWNLSPPYIIIEGPENKVNNDLFDLKLMPVKLNPKSNLYYGKVMLQELPKFIKLSENQPFEIQLELKYYSEEEFKNKINQLPLGFNYFEEEVSVMCKNNIGRIEIANEPKVKISYISKYYLTSNAFTADVYCPVELDPNTEIIKPSSFIKEIPVIVKTKFEINDMEILKIDPLLVDLEFKVKKKTPINQLEKGLQEHLIR